MQRPSNRGAMFHRANGIPIQKGTLKGPFGKQKQTLKIVRPLLWTAALNGSSRFARPQVSATPKGHSAPCSEGGSGVDHALHT